MSVFSSCKISIAPFTRVVTAPLCLFWIKTEKIVEPVAGNAFAKKAPFGSCHGFYTKGGDFPNSSKNERFKCHPFKFY